LGSQIIERSSTVDVSIPSDLVSRHHAELYWDGERLRIRDLGSRNGTAVNGNPVVDWVDLRDGDVILFGTIQGVIEVGG
jgi:pSer/pThr/pTyr-binding forkhead associated (FHA) protein